MPNFIKRKQYNEGKFGKSKEKRMFSHKFSMEISAKFLMTKAGEYIAKDHAHLKNIFHVLAHGWPMLEYESCMYYLLT
jgi:hypothetical protein